MVTDNTGLTPAQLAADKNHRQVAFFLVGPFTFNWLIVLVWLVVFCLHNIDCGPYCKTKNTAQVFP